MIALIVDDDVINLNATSRGLSRKGWHCHKASNLAEVKMALNCGPFDVILTDWHPMGPLVIDMAKGTPVVVFSGAHPKALKQDYPELLGSREVLAKPVNPKTLDQTLRKEGKFI